VGRRPADARLKSPDATRQLVDRDGGAKPTPTTTSIVLEGSAETEQLSVLLLSFFARSPAVDFGTPAVSHGFDESCVPSRSRDLYRGNCLLAGGGADLFNTKILWLELVPGRRNSIACSARSSGVAAVVSQSRISSEEV
jgi:hypothetical protein